jgi:pimeloyl-ACP methyl ester carboxylesterase
MSDSSTGSQTSGTRLPFDYPGFGSSDPLAGSPTFDRLAEITGKVIDALGVNEYAIYMFDFGAPVGFSGVWPCRQVLGPHSSSTL